MNRVCTARTLTSLRATYSMSLKKTQCNFVGHMETYPSYGQFGKPNIPCPTLVMKRGPFWGDGHQLIELAQRNRNDKPEPRSANKWGPFGPKEISLDQVEICNIKISAFTSPFDWSLIEDVDVNEDEYVDELCLYAVYFNEVNKTEDPLFVYYNHVSSFNFPKVHMFQLDLCWEQDPLTTLKLICNMRSVRGAGKSSREEFYTAAIWLYKFHPKTLAHNVRTFAEFGYLKDLLEILYRILEGPYVRYDAYLQRLKQQRQPKELSMAPVESMNVLAELAGIKTHKENARLFRKEKFIMMAKRARDMYNCDENYRFLHNQIADLFAQLLKSDIEFLKSGNIGKISLAAKWCPSLNSSYDRVTLLCESIARRVFPYDSAPEYRVIEDAHYVYRVRDRLRKQVLVPLRKALRLPEVYMSTNQWNLLPYHQVSSLAMELKNIFFFKHDKKRFLSYHKTLKMSQTDIILRSPKFTDLLRYRRNGVLLEMQFMRMVEDLRKKGIFKNCIAFYAKDANHSIREKTSYGKYMRWEVPYWIGLLVSELSENPWKGKVFGCQNNPQILKIEGNNLESKLGFLKSIEGDGKSIELSMMLDKILETALHLNLSEDKMVKRVIIDVHHNFSCLPDTIHDWDTIYEPMRSKYESNGYSLPHVLCLAPFFDDPFGYEGLTVVHPPRKEIIDQFVEADGNLDPISVMEFAISSEKFKKLEVHD